jgi:hypothetical protein
MSARSCQAGSQSVGPEIQAASEFCQEQRYGMVKRRSLELCS